MHDLPWDLECRMLPGDPPLHAPRRPFVFMCSRAGGTVRVRIPGTHRGPDNVDADVPAQARWLNSGPRRELLEVRWACEWNLVHEDAFEAFVALLAPTLSAPNAPAQKQLEELRRSVYSKPAETIVEATRLLADSPAWAEMLLVRGEAKERQKDVAGARDDCDLAVAASPDNVAALLRAGSLRIADPALGEEALALFTRAVSLAPADNGARYHYTRQLQRVGCTEEALAELERGAPFMAHPERWFLEGQWLDELGRHQEAAAALEEAVRYSAGRRAIDLLAAVRAKIAAT